MRNETARRIQRYLDFVGGVVKMLGLLLMLELRAECSSIEMSMFNSALICEISIHILVILFLICSKLTS